MAPVFINFNGEIHSVDTKLITAGNRAFRYGDGLFESMRLMKGQLKFADLHADRLQRAGKRGKLMATVGCLVPEGKSGGPCTPEQGQTRPFTFNCLPGR